MIIRGGGQPSKLVYLIVLSQLVGPPPARRIVGLVTVDGISHFFISPAGFSSSHPDGTGREHQPGRQRPQHAVPDIKPLPRFTAAGHAQRPDGLTRPSPAGYS
jgi:hypothetical protein